MNTSAVTQTTTKEEEVIKKAHEIAKRHGIEAQIEEEAHNLRFSKNILPKEWAYPMALGALMLSMFDDPLSNPEIMQAEGWTEQDEIDFYYEELTMTS